MLSRNTLLWINRLVWTLLVGAVILLGSVVSLGRYFVPSIEAHQQEIIAEINRRTGLQFSAAHLSGSWKRLSPYFVVDDLRLQDPRDPSRDVLQIAHAEIQLGIFRSIAGGTIAISRLRGSGVHVELEEAELGRWRLAGFSGEGKMRLDRALDFLAAIYRAELNDSIIDLRFFGGGDAQLLAETLRLQRAGDFRRFNLDVKFVGDESVQKRSEPLRVVFETQGDPRSIDRFSGRGYSEFRGVDLTPVLPAAKALGLNLEHGRIDGAAWMQWRAGGAVELSGRAEIPQFDLVGLSKLDLEPIKNIKTQFLVRDNKGRRQFWFPELSGNWHGVDLKFPRVSATVDGAQPQRALIAMPELVLSPMLETMLADGNLSQHARDVLTTLAPQGALHNLYIDLPLRADQLSSWRLRAQLHDISVQPWQGAPGATNVSGFIDAGAHAGRIDLLSKNFSMAFPHVYHEPLHFDEVTGQVDWRIENDRALVDSGPLYTKSDAGTATAQVSLDLPFAHGARPLMTLQVGLRNSATQYRDRFIPYILQPSLLQWLQRAIGKGDIPVGGFIYRGSLLANDHLNNTVQLFLDARNAELAYEPEWPPLRDINAAVWVDDTLLRVEAKSARLYQRITVRDAEVNLLHDADSSWLTVDAQANADNDDILRLLRETPIRKQLGAALDHWRWRGPTQSRVQLGIPISGTHPQEISVDSHLNGGSLELLDQNIVLDDVRGDISYRSAAAEENNKGLHTDNLKAKWFERPVIMNVATASDGAISVNARGHIAMSDLKQWLQQPLFDFTSGEVAFVSSLRIGNGSTTLQVDSDLQGAAIDLPTPYHKTAEQILPLALTMEMNGEPHLTATLSDWADLQLHWDRGESSERGSEVSGALQLASGLVRLGPKAKAEQQGKTDLHHGLLTITGAVESTNLSEWGEAARAHPVAMGRDVQEESSPRLAVQLREVKFGSAQVGGQVLHNLTVSGRKDSAAWSVQMRADQIAGVLTLPDDKQQPWRAQLNYLRLPAAPESKVQIATDSLPQKLESEASALADVDPRNVSAFDVHIDQLWRGDENFGWIEAQVRPLENGMRLDHLRGQLRGVKIEAREQQPARMSWTRENNIDRSDFFGRLAVDDIAQTLQRFKYEPVLTSKSGYADVDFHWSGRPDQFKFVQTDGETSLRFDEGQFTRASNSATGALKVVGIFNFANFLRRLQFDFKDIYKEGLSFDEMQGSFKTHEGVLTLTEPVEIKSPSSRFRLTGQIDFNSDQTDMELAATLPVASNLPWVAALTGALPAAAGLYVASKVFEDQLDKFSSATYAVSGSWADPQVKLRRVFDDKLPAKNESTKTNAESVKKKNEPTEKNDAAIQAPASEAPAEIKP
ncbi:MAG: YhdP family protein [Spongiibacteraceae bacterium]